MTYDPTFPTNPDAAIGDLPPEHPLRDDPGLRERIAQGTEDLGEEARKRVIAARERAVAAGRHAKRNAAQAQERGVDMFERQPLIVGALAFAIGAAIGAALPRTRLEDGAFGQSRDELVSEAERIFNEEKARARAALKDAGNEAEAAVRDAAQAAKAKVAEHLPNREDVKDAPADTVSRVGDKAVSSH